MAKTKVQVEYVPMHEPSQDPYTTEPTNYLQLLGAIRAAKSTNRLKHLVQEYGGVFGTEHLATALATLPKLAQYRPEDLTRGTLLTLPTPLAQPQPDPQDSSKGPSSAAGPCASPASRIPLAPRIPRPGCKPRPSFIDTAQPLAMQLMAMLVGQANVRFADPEWRSPGGKRASKHTTLWKLKVPAQLAGAQGSTAVTDCRGPKEEPEVPLGLRFGPRDASTSLYALGCLARLGVHLDPQLLRGCVEDCLAAFTTGQSLARAGAGPAPGRDGGAPVSTVDVAMLVRALSLLRPQKVVASQKLLERLAQWTREHAADFSVMDVQMALRGFALLGHRDPELVAALAARAATSASGMTPRLAASVLQALAMLDRRARPTRDAGGGAAAAGAAAGGHGTKESHTQRTLCVLASTIAPQVTLMSPEDLAALASCLARLGMPYVQHFDATASTPPASPPPGPDCPMLNHDVLAWGDEQLKRASGTAANLSGLPGWLHGLACFLADKAHRDLPTLAPEQLAAVLGMLRVLRVPHGTLLRAAVDGVLAQRQLDPALPPAAAAALLRAVGELEPLLPAGGQGLEPLPPPPSVVPYRPTHLPPKVIRELEKRQTALGLGNVPDPTLQCAAPSAAALARAGNVAGSGGGGGVDEASDAAGAHGLALAAIPPESRPAPPQHSRHAYLALLQDPGTPFTTRAHAAMERVLSVYSPAGGLPEVLKQSSLEALADLAEGLAAAACAGVEGVGVVLEKVALAAEGRMEEVKERQLRGPTSLMWAELQLHEGKRLLSVLSGLGHRSAHLSGAASGMVGRILEAAPPGDVGAVATLLSPALELLAACRAHGAEPAPAATQAAATLYINTVMAVSNGTAASAVAGLPAHTASGLVATPAIPGRKGKTKGRVQGMLVHELDGPLLASLLKACATSGALDDALARVTALHAQQLWVAGGGGGEGQGEGGDTWVVECAGQLLGWVAALQRDGRLLPAEVAEALALLVQGARQVAACASEQHSTGMQALEAHLVALKPPYNVLARSTESAL